jgi:hypothetical protein
VLRKESGERERGRKKESGGTEEEEMGMGAGWQAVSLARCDMRERTEPVTCHIWLTCCTNPCDQFILPQNWACSNDE